MRIQPPKHHVLLCSEQAESFDPWPGDVVTFASGKYLVGRDCELISLEPQKPKDSKKIVQTPISVGAN